MSLKLEIEQELVRVQALGAGGLLAIDLPSGRLEVVLTAVDAIGCAFETCTFTTPQLAGATIESLKKLSAALTARLSYLLEPISLIEADALSSTVQLRSSPPQQSDDGRSYYELVVTKGGHLQLCRYLKATGQMRQIVPAQVTRQVLARLGEDFVAVIG